MSKYHRLTTRQIVTITRMVDDLGMQDKRTIGGADYSFLAWTEEVTHAQFCSQVRAADPGSNVSDEAIDRARREAGGITYAEWARTPEGRDQIAYATSLPFAAASDVANEKVIARLTAQIAKLDTEVAVLVAEKVATDERIRRLESACADKLN